MTDPRPEYWRRQAAQLTVINAIRSLIDQEPDRFTGLSTAGSGHLTIHLIDPTVRHDERLVTLLDNARVADIEVEFTESPRSLRELTAIHDEILRTDLFKRHGVRGATFGIDPATATIGITVADSAVDLVRRVCARYGEAVVVNGTGPVDLSTRLERHAGSRDGWPVPTLAPEEAAGRATKEIAELYRREGFEVEIYHLGDPYILNADLRSHRIRLLVHDGRVVDATQA